MSNSEHMSSLEVKILREIDSQLKKFQSDKNSTLISKWFQEKGIKNPKISNEAYKGNITFIAKDPKANYTGPGIMIFPMQNSKMNCYIGDFRDGQREGKGWRLMKGYIYIGDYKNDTKHGNAIMLKEENGALIFKGKFADDKMHGECFWADPSHTFRGRINMQVYDGKCEIVYPNGDKFTGNMDKGNINGRGKLEYGNGDVYEGEFNKNLMNGKGTYIWKNGERYNGNFVDGKIRGQGQMISPIGVKAEGDFSNKKLEFKLM